MRKIFTVLAALLIAFVLNFTLWFLHTRTIAEKITTLQADLQKERGIILSYDDILFSTFKSWEVSGDLVNFKIKSKYGNELTVERLGFDSLPFDNQLLFTINSEIEAKGQDFGEATVNWEPRIPLIAEIHFHKDAKTSSLQSYGDVISAVNLSLPQLDLTSKEDGSIMARLYPTSFTYKSERNSNRNVESINLDSKGLEFISDKFYADIPPELKVFVKNMGKTTTELDLRVERYGRGEKGARDFTDMQFTYNKSRLSNNLFSFDINGHFHTKNTLMLKDIDITLSLENPDTFVDYTYEQVKYYNSVSSEFKSDPSFDIDFSRKQELKNLLKKFNKDNNSVSLVLKQSNSGLPTVSGMPILDFLRELHFAVYGNKMILPANAMPQ